MNLVRRQIVISRASMAPTSDVEGTYLMNKKLESVLQIPVDLLPRTSSPKGVFVELPPQPNLEAA